MPNWIINVLIVAGPAADIARFKNDAANHDQALSLDKLIPYPAEYRDADLSAQLWEEANYARKEGRLVLRDGAEREDRPLDGFNHGGYEWCISAWGCKWDLCDVSLEKDDSEELDYWFRTPNSHPLSGFLSISTLYPLLRFCLSYTESCGQWGGLVNLLDGAITEQSLDGKSAPWPCPVCGNASSFSRVKVVREGKEGRKVFETYYRCGDPFPYSEMPDRCGFRVFVRYAGGCIEDLIYPAANEYARKHRVSYNAVPPCHPECMKYVMEVSPHRPYELVKRCRLTGYWCVKGSGDDLPREQEGHESQEQDAQ